MKLRGNWGHASALDSKRVSADSEREAMGLVNYEDEVLEQCAICRASDKSPHIPIAETSTVLGRNGQL